jgi:class 3 adenylate cyclase/tetratricopeptide (TPR) repeat protein
VICSSCASENRPGASFCRGCGASLENRCPDCGAAVEEGQAYCDGCGTRLGAEAPLSPARPDPVAERRLVSVLFADLVGFTVLSESRDAEEVRELLSRYFETCRRLVERYGGTVEKFIGDAVMAVWGTPTANEDDAERAVRTALDLVAAAAGIADELGVAELRLRAGVLTGEAAVTVGAQGEGMVAGDLVNAASRIQSAADPGAVLVGDSTRRATEAAIAYEDAGFHQLRGKAEPVRLHRALRVIAARRGEGRAAGLEAPFVGREPEFRLVKDLFHACAEEGRSRLVSIVGTAGVGKSRLAWEFEKYIDGLADDVRWHRGRCLAYGDGVAYWALAEMVRMRARITEEDHSQAAQAKLRETLAAIVRDPDERSFLEPRLAHLLGLADRSAPDKEDLFSAWRIFFERMAAREPVVLLFEDLQWADDGLLDFVEYLLDWSRTSPIFVLTLARPELAEKRSAWGAGRRDFTSLFLESLEPDDIEELLHALAPGLPEELRARIVERAEGVPLYAVETVRMLLDRGLLKLSGDRYQPTGPIESLAIPETLQSLAAARLDALDPAERRLLSDAAVLGRTFTRPGLAALSGLPKEELEPQLESLLRKEILTIQVDPFSPERNQVSFGQDLLRRVAYETLSIKERKARHLAVAAHLGADRDGEEEIAAVIAAHYLDAYRAGPGDPDAPTLKAKARAALTRAAERAASLASAGEAARYFAQAAALVEEPLERAELLERSGRAATQDGNLEQANEALQQAIDLLEAGGERHAAARVSARRAEALRVADRVDEAFALMQTSYEALAGGDPDADVALVAAQLARLAYFAGERERAVDAVEVALDMAEALRLPEVLAEALTTKAMVGWDRPHEAEALLREANRVATANDLPAAALRAQFNLSGLGIEHSRFREARSILDEALALARVRGDRSWEAVVLGQLADALVQLGEWDEAEARCRELLDTPQQLDFPYSLMLIPLGRILCERGELEEGRTLMSHAHRATTSDRQSQAAFLLAEASLSRAEGRTTEALTAAEASLEQWRALRQFHYLGEALVVAAEAAFELDDLERVEALVVTAEQLPLIQRRPLLDAQTARLGARLAARRDEPPGDGFDVATQRFRELEMPFWVGVTQLEHGEHLVEAGHSDEAEPLIAEARGIFERLRAEPWLRRARPAARERGAATRLEA